MSKYNKPIFLFGLFLPIFVLLLTIGRSEYSLSEPEPVRLRAVGYDPRSLLSGHYLRVEIDWSNTDCRQFEGGICPKERFRNNYRYYVPEQSARGLEQKISSGQYVVELEFAYPNQGEPKLLNLLLDGKKWADIQISD